MKLLTLLFLGLLTASPMQAHRSFLAVADTVVTDTLACDTAANDSLKRLPMRLPGKKKEEKKESEYVKLMKKGGIKTPGLFTVHHIEDKYYFEVPDSLMGRMLLCVSRFTGVPQDFGKFAGEEVNNFTVYLEQRDTSQVLMRQYVLSHLADSTDNISRTLEQSTIDPIVLSFKIVPGSRLTDDASATDTATIQPPAGTQLIEVTPLFKGASKFTSLSSGLSATLKLGGLAGDRTYIDTMKVFPTNIEIVTTRTYGATPARSEASKTGNITLGMNTSIVLLPKEPMRKRLWDKRVGYFVNNFVRFSDDQRKTDHESFVSRYRLVPKNKKKYLRGELSEPEKPIVYYIDPATPKKWIPYLIQGVNDWNVAFEAAGFKNAIVAKLLPENDPNISLDDARYSAIRYLPSETENAYGPRIVDPRSGEIIEAHVCWYHNVMNLLTKWYMVQCGPLDKRAQTMKFDDKLMGELIRFVSSHEVGHTLGLRHNMGASSATPVEKLRDKAWVERHGHTASIMDYARFNYVAQPEDKISEKGLFPRINDYDCWAIKWGYQWRPDFKDEYEEKEKLMTETTNTLRSNPRLWFGGEGMGSDPRSQTEDLGDNSMKASEYGVKNLKRVMANLRQWTRQDNDQYEDLQTIYQQVLNQFGRYQGHVMKNIGTRYQNNMPGTEPVENVPVALQREAISYLGRHIFDAPEWLYPADIINKVEINPTVHQNSRQEAAIERLLSASLLFSIYGQSATGSEAYPLDQYLDDVFATVWTPLGNADDWKTRERRNLQRCYVDQLNRLINPTGSNQQGSRTDNSDVLLYVLLHLDKVENYLKSQQAQGLNALHYQDLQERVQLIRERRKSPVQPVR
jgi:hypothetical protein